MNSISHITQTRENFTKLIDSLSTDQLNQIPDGFNNNLIWNYAHNIVTMQLLCYKLSGLDINIPEDVLSKYRKGTKPEAFIPADEILLLKKLCRNTAHQLAEDVKNESFHHYNKYETSFGVVLECIEDAIAFDAVHEGVHLGYALAMKKLVGVV